MEKEINYEAKKMIVEILGKQIKAIEQAQNEIIAIDDNNPEFEDLVTVKIIKLNKKIEQTKEVLK